MKYTLEVNGRPCEIEVPEIVVNGLATGEYTPMPQPDMVNQSRIVAVDIYDKNERIVFHCTDFTYEQEPEVLPGAMHLVELVALAPSDQGIIAASVTVNPANICFYQEANVPNRECVGVTFSGNVQLVIDMSYDNFTKFLQSLN